MKRKLSLTCGILVFLFVFILILIGPGATLLVRLGLQPVCIQGHWPNLHLVHCPGIAGAPDSRIQVTNLRIHLSFDDLMNGFESDSPIDEQALSMPVGAEPPVHTFEGRLELSGQEEHGQVEVLRGGLELVEHHLPAFNFEFVERQGNLIPIQRGVIVTEHPTWNYILEPGRAWQEPNDGGFSRASFPFTLVVKGGNASFNGTMTFLYDDLHVSRVWYQITQETTTYTRANFWGLLDGVYHPGAVAGAERIWKEFLQEQANRMPVKHIEALADDYPGVTISAFGRGVTPEHMTWYGVVVDGVNYIGGCQTRFGTYPYCQAMRTASYSTSKSAFVSVALMRLAQLDGLQVMDQRIKDYVPEYAASPGNWEQVTFNHVIDMSSGNYSSPDYMKDEDSARMGQYHESQPYARRIASAFDWPSAAEPGQHWVYRTSDTYILTRALQNYLQSQTGGQSDIFDFVVQQVYQPLGLGPGVFSSMRTADQNWQGQAEGGYGLWWVPDDIAQLSQFLNVQNGKIDGDQVLHPGLLSASLQHDPNDRGVRIDANRMYNNAFWATRYPPAQGYECDFWAPQMLGVSGNVVVLFPNGVTYYYFSDNQEFTWEAALREIAKIKPLCTR